MTRIFCVQTGSTEQETINQVIRDVLSCDPIARQELQRKVVSIGDLHMKNRGAEAVVLACTELPIIFSGSVPSGYLSTIEILSKSLRKESENFKPRTSKCV